MVSGALREAGWPVILQVLETPGVFPREAAHGLSAKTRGLGVQAPVGGQCHKGGTHTLPSSKDQGSPRNECSPRDSPY